MVPAILNHMPVWAGVSIVASMAAGTALGCYMNRRP